MKEAQVTVLNKNIARSKQLHDDPVKKINEATMKMIKTYWFDRTADLPVNDIHFHLGTLFKKVAGRTCEPTDVLLNIIELMIK